MSWCADFEFRGTYRALRLTRALKVLNMSKSLRKIVQTVVSSLPGTLNVSP